MSSTYYDKKIHESVKELSIILEQELEPITSLGGSKQIKNDFVKYLCAV